MGRGGQEGLGGETLEQHGLLSPVQVYQGGDDLLKQKDAVGSGRNGSHLA